LRLFFSRVELALRASDEQWRYFRHGILGYQRDDERDRDQWRRAAVKTYPQ
jgi:hypothetical protein